MNNSNLDMILDITRILLIVMIIYLIIKALLSAEVNTEEIKCLTDCCKKGLTTIIKLN